jgi:hypothetical protein
MHVIHGIKKIFIKLCKIITENFNRIIMQKILFKIVIYSK